MGDFMPNVRSDRGNLSTNETGRQAQERSEPPHAGVARGACSTPTQGQARGLAGLTPSSTAFACRGLDCPTDGGRPPALVDSASRSADTPSAREIAAVTRRCVSPPRLDGNTTWALDLPLGWRETAGAEAKYLLEQAARRRSPGAAARDAAAGGRSITLPSWSGPITALLRVGGERRQRITLHVPDVMHVVIDTERSPKEGYGGRITVQLKAPVLWSVARELVPARVQEWLYFVTRWTLGVGQEHAMMRRWTCIAAELCADFTSLRFTQADAQALVVPRAHMSWREYGTTTYGKASRCNGVAFGQRGGTVALALYDKTEEVRAHRSGDATPYETTWRAHGWMEHEQVGRVEFRLASHGLVWTDMTTGEVFELRTLDDMRPENLDRIWGLLVQRMRLGVPGSASQRKRWAIDARWHAVRGAAAVVEVKARQLREVQEGMHRRAVQRAALDVWRASTRLAALHGVVPRTHDALLRIAAEAERHIVHDVREVLLGEAAIAGYARRRAFIGREMDAAREAWREAKAREWWDGLDVVLVSD